jgi:hypothetical protein
MIRCRNGANDPLKMFSVTEFGTGSEAKAEKKQLDITTEVSIGHSETGR